MTYLPYISPTSPLYLPYISRIDHHPRRVHRGALTPTLTVTLTLILTLTLTLTCEARGGEGALEPRRAVGHHRVLPLLLLGAERLAGQAQLPAAGEHTRCLAPSEECARRAARLPPAQPAAQRLAARWLCGALLRHQLLTAHPRRAAPDAPGQD